MGQATTRLVEKLEKRRGTYAFEIDVPACNGFTVSQQRNLPRKLQEPLLTFCCELINYSQVISIGAGFDFPTRAWLLTVTIKLGGKHTSLSFADHVNKVVSKQTNWQPKQLPDHAYTQIVNAIDALMGRGR